MQMQMKKDKRSGIALVMAALLCLALIPMVGLAVDGTTAYLMRAEMSAALDAAVLAGARSLNTGLTVNAQASNATSVATSVFNANVAGMNWHFPTAPAPSFSVNQDDTNHYRTVVGTASATLPLSMMALVGFRSTNITVNATAQRRDVNLMLVLDHSGSMSQVIGSLRTDAIDFVNQFASGRDRLGLVVFGGSDFVAYSPATTFQTDSPSVPTLIGQLNAYGATNTSSAIWAAYQQLVTLNQPGALNAIVLFTDGLANTVSANFSSFVAANAGCNITGPLNGAITTDTGGVPLGLFDPTATSLNDKPETRPAPNANGCLQVSTTIASLLTGLPSVDLYGDSTNGTGTISAYSPVNLSLVNGSTVISIGLNAFDDAANRVRSDKTLNPVIYTIGLGNNPGTPPDQVLMARVANDPGSIYYNSGQPAGLFIFSPTITQLHSAFLRIASEILRLTK